MVANVPDEVRWWQRLHPVRQADEFPDDESMVVLGLTKDSSIAEFQNRLVWGTFGRPAQHPVQWKRLRELDTEHLENILVSQRQIPHIYSRAILGILRERYELRRVQSRLP